MVSKEHNSCKVEYKIGIYGFFELYKDMFEELGSNEQDALQ